MYSKINMLGVTFGGSLKEQVRELESSVILCRRFQGEPGVLHVWCSSRLCRIFVVWDGLKMLLC